MVAAVAEINEPLTREELIEALGHLSHRAQREIPKVGTADFPTPWDLRHREIDKCITNLQALGF